jgi:serine/threonine protein kinase
MNEHPDNLEDPRLMEAVRQYQADLDGGRRPSRRDFLARCPDIAAELSECLEGLEFLYSAAPRLHRDSPAVAAPLEPDGTLGDFRLLREVGRGGMGVVYEALQLSLGRRVALKVLPLAATLDARQLQRFENEARAAAHLHHGNIVPVFAVGCERGVHYYAMQFIDGRTLAAVIDHLRQAPAPAAPAADTAAGAGSLTGQSINSPSFFRGVATLGVQAAEALEYAHQMGVVHRDVKPANLLLDGRGNLWVTDFGLARFQANPSFTAPGDLVGTLRYMSPEQAAGQPVIDPRSDVYSLGATLYELLTLQPAFGARDRRECLRQILETEPAPPRRLNRAIPPELETVVLKAMGRQPEDRYASARELAEDLRRFLDDRPVQARRPGLRERSARWARRHRRLVAGAMLGLVAAVLVLALTTWQVARAEARTASANDKLREEQAALEEEKAKLKEEERRTREALAREVAQRDRAENNYRQARKVLDFLTRLGVEELADRPQLQGLRKKLLSELLDYYQEFIDQQGEDEPAPELVEARVQVAELLDEIGRKEESRAAFARAMRDQARLPWLGFGPPRRFSRHFLLGQPTVQKDLKLSDEQVKRVASVGPGRPRGPGAGEDRASDLLTSEQADRLEQIARQWRGPRALLDPEAAEALCLTKEQKKAIQTALNGAMKERRPGGGRGRGRRGGRQPPVSRQQLNEQVLKVLLPEQRQRWQALLGEPFQGAIRFGGPHPHFPPHPR